MFVICFQIFEFEFVVGNFNYYECIALGILHWLKTFLRNDMILFARKYLIKDIF